MLGIITNAFSCSVKKMLHKCLIRPHFEFCIHAMNPYHQHDIDTIINTRKHNALNLLKLALIPALPV